MFKKATSGYKFKLQNTRRMAVRQIEQNCTGNDFLWVAEGVKWVKERDGGMKEKNRGR